MRYQEIALICEKYLFFFAASLVLPTGIAAYYQWISTSYHPQPHSGVAFLATLAITLLLAFFARVRGRAATGMLFRREGIAAVLIIWIITCTLGALPYCLSGTLKPIDALFESVSGFTTTGATIMEAKSYDEAGHELPIVRQNSAYFGTVTPIRDESGALLAEGIEASGTAILFWRSFTNWLGGMGVVVLLLAILPALGVGGRFLFTSEVTGPIKDTLTPSIKQTAALLWKMYFGLTIAQITLLLVASDKMSFF